MKNNRPTSYTCEEAFVFALQKCDDNASISKAIERIKSDCLVAANNMDAYDDFVVENTDFRYCSGCQSYHDSVETEFDSEGACRYSRDELIALNEALYKQGLKRREDLRDEYYHR